MLGTVLTIAIPALVFGYGIWLAVRMIRHRNRGGCCSGCGSCPYAGDCSSTAACRLNTPKEKGDSAE
jgi:hypothetical protein